MRFSERWLREWVDPAENTDQLVERLTMAGLEVDACLPVAGQFSEIVVGEIQAVEQHPEADRLHICQVNDGSQVLQVVCGAPNVRPGMKAPFARIGAKIQRADGMTEISKTKLRGVESHGMLCAAAELGLGDDADGLLELPGDAPAGVMLRSYLDLDDISIELDLTPNRGDCLGIMGLAREISTLTRTELTPPEILPVKATISDQFKVKISAPSACPRYIGRVIRGVDPQARTPLWVREKLRRCGLRSIDPIVDVTNYVLIELGQPLHAFDLGKLQGAIDIRHAHDEEQLTLLDGKTVKLIPDTLVIADNSGAVAMAGIMGGLRTAVDRSTVDVFLECAFFAPLAIAGKARLYALHTDASHRYERGVDWNLQRKAIERATRLLIDLAGGSPGPVTEIIGTLPASRQVELRLSAIERLLGIAISAQESIGILSHLGLELIQESKSVLKFQVPSFRSDIEQEADLIEELARVYGYSRLPSSTCSSRLRLKTTPETRAPLISIKQLLVNQGYQEVITYSFIDPKLSDRLLGSGDEKVQLENPISSEMSLMRSSLMPGLLHALSHNFSRQQDRARLFETGLVFRKLNGSLDQAARIAGLICGTRLPSNWTNNREQVDYFDLKGDVESLLDSLLPLAQVRYLPATHAALQPGQCSAIEIDGSRVGILGKLHPGRQRELDIGVPVFLFELELDKLNEGKIPEFKELSKFPEVSRDIAVVLDSTVQAAQILAAVRSHAGDFLTGLRIFDVYQGDAIGENKKSVAVGLTWQHPSRTLGDEEITLIIANCVKALEQQFNANLRT